MGSDKGLRIISVEGGAEPSEPLNHVCGGEVEPHRLPSSGEDEVEPGARLSFGDRRQNAQTAISPRIAYGCQRGAAAAARVYASNKAINCV